MNMLLFMSAKCSISLTDKLDLFNRLDDKKVFPTKFNNGSKFRLKNIQDFIVLSNFRDFYKGFSKKDITVAEIGGDQSRIAEIICKNKNVRHYDIIDVFDVSIGRGTTNKPNFQDSKIDFVDCLLGSERSKSIIPDCKYDFICSVSVIEHIDWDLLRNFFEENLRVLSPTGYSYHCIDVKLDDSERNKFVEKLISTIDSLEVPLEVKENDWSFKTRFATQPDDVQIKWCRNYSEQKRITGLNSQTCNIELKLQKDN